MSNLNLEFVTRDFGQDIAAVGHVVTNDLRCPVMSMGEIQINKVNNDSGSNLIDVTISKKTNSNIIDSYGDPLYPSDDMTSIVRNSIWRGATIELNDILLGQYVALDTFFTKGESQSKEHLAHNRCMVTSVMKKTADINSGLEHIHWTTIDATESDYGYHFRMEAEATNKNVYLRHRKGSTLNDQFRGECLTDIMRTCMWRDMDGELFAFRWLNCKEVVRTMTEARAATVNGEEASKTLTDKIHELNISHLCCNQHPDEQFIDYIKFLHKESPVIDMEEFNHFLPNVTMLTMVGKKSEMYLRKLS